MTAPRKAPREPAGVPPGSGAMRAVDLFCGVGGLSQGLSDAGFDVVAAYDDWRAAIEIYGRNLPHAATRADLLNVREAAEAISLHHPDVIAGGPPCQDFSTAGHRVEGSHASLTVAYATIVSLVRPRFALMENVPPARLSTAFERALALLHQSGYQVWRQVLDASHCGVPQARKRFFLFAWRDGAPRDRAMDSWIADHLSKRPLTVKQYLKDEIDIEYYYRHPRNYSRRAIFTVHEPSPTIRGVNRPVPPNYRRNRLDSAPPEGVRPLTFYERSRVQTFPPSWRWMSEKPGKPSKTDAELLIGNAVPVGLAAFVGRAMLHAAS